MVGTANVVMHVI